MHRIGLIMLIFLIIYTGCNQSGNNQTSDIDPDYLDPYRPQIHYSRHTGWLSDPNGLYYHDGEWHLMFQGFSNREKWEGTNWDHAVSNDLLHWEHQPTVLKAAAGLSYYSGSAYVDTANVSGLGTKQKIPVLAFYTTHPMPNHPVRPNQNYISIAHSLDNGKSWTYGNRHIIDNSSVPSERDPSVFYHEPSGKYVMATIGDQCIRLYSSPNLLDWTFESEALRGHSWECPDMNIMTVQETGEEKVVLITSKHGVPNSSHGTAYHVGTFDGHHFNRDDTSSTLYWMDWGSDFYAGITYANAPNGRVLFQSWFGWPCQFHKTMAPTSKFSGTMNLIRELTLHQDENGKYIIKSIPIDAYRSLRTDSVTTGVLTLSGRNVIRNKIGSHEPLEIILEAELEEGVTFGIRLKNDFGEDYIFKYDDWQKHFIGDRTKAGTHPRHYTKNYNDLSRMPYELKNHKLKLHIFWDVSTFEVFVDEGRKAFSQLLYPREPFTTIELFSTGGNTDLGSVRIYNLTSIWQIGGKR